MAPIYTPKGRAREYSPKALNVYLSCAHGCRYCYAPHAIQKSAGDYFSVPSPRRTVVADLERQLSKEEVHEQVLLSFVGDPYGPSDDGNRATRDALEILLAHKVPVAILTKSGDGPLQDIDLIKAFGPSIMVGASLTFDDEGLSKEWEPGAATPAERLKGLKALHDAGVKTFASFEPVIDPAESLKAMRRSLDMGCVDLYKVGKLNGMPEVERGIDWTAFLSSALGMLRSEGREVYVKEDLRRAAPSVAVTAEESDPDLHTVRWEDPPLRGQRTLEDW